MGRATRSVLTAEEKLRRERIRHQLKRKTQKVTWSPEQKQKEKDRQKAKREKQKLLLSEEEKARRLALKRKSEKKRREKKKAEGEKKRQHRDSAGDGDAPVGDATTSAHADAAHVLASLMGQFSLDSDDDERPDPERAFAMKSLLSSQYVWLTEAIHHKNEEPECKAAPIELLLSLAWVLYFHGQDQFHEVLEWVESLRVFPTPGDAISPGDWLKNYKRAARESQTPLRVLLLFYTDAILCFFNSPAAWREPKKSLERRVDRLVLAVELVDELAQENGSGWLSTSFLARVKEATLSLGLRQDGALARLTLKHEEYEIPYWMIDFIAGCRCHLQQKRDGVVPVTTEWEIPPFDSKCGALPTSNMQHTLGDWWEYWRRDGHADKSTKSSGPRDETETAPRGPPPVPQDIRERLQNLQYSVRISDTAISTKVARYQARKYREEEEANDPSSRESDEDDKYFLAGLLRSIQPARQPIEPMTPMVRYVASLQKYWCGWMRHAIVVPACLAATANETLFVLRYAIRRYQRGEFAAIFDAATVASIGRDSDGSASHGADGFNIAGREESNGSKDSEDSDGDVGYTSEDYDGDGEDLCHQLDDIPGFKEEENEDYDLDFEVSFAYTNYVLLSSAGQSYFDALLVIYMDAILCHGEQLVTVGAELGFLSEEIDRLITKLHAAASLADNLFYARFPPNTFARVQKLVPYSSKPKEFEESFMCIVKACADAPLECPHGDWICDCPLMSVETPAATTDSIGVRDVSGAGADTVSSLQVSITKQAADGVSTHTNAAVQEVGQRGDDDDDELGDKMGITHIPLPPGILHESATTPEDDSDVVFVRVQASEMDVNDSPTWAAKKAAIEVTEISTLANGHCFASAVVGVTYSTTPRDLYSRSMVKKATHHHEALCQFQIDHLDALAADNVIDLGRRCEVVTGTSAISIDATDRVLDQLETKRAISCHTQLPRVMWAGPEEHRVACLWLRRPLIVFDVMPDGRAWAVVYVVSQRVTTTDTMRETVDEHQLSFSEATALMAAFKAANVIPYAFALHHSIAPGGEPTGHFTALRVDPARYTASTTTAAGGASMLSRLDELLRSYGWYPTGTSPFAYDKATRMTKPQLLPPADGLASGSVYNASLASSDGSTQPSPSEPEQPTGSALASIDVEQPTPTPSDSTRGRVTSIRCS